MNVQVAAAPTEGAGRLSALFALGMVTASITHREWWRGGARLVLIAGAAALAAALVAAALRV
jgi:hypothetical protein